MQSNGVCSLLSQLPAAEGDYKQKIVQRGAVQPLIEMLGNDDNQLREMAAFALGRLAQNTDNQAGVVASGGLLPLLDLLETCQSNLQVRPGAGSRLGLCGAPLCSWHHDGRPWCCELEHSGNVWLLLDFVSVLEQRC
jgi:hypothetical protein